MTVIEIRPHRWGWKAFKAPGVEPVFPKKDNAIEVQTKCRPLRGRRSLQHNPDGSLTIYLGNKSSGKEKESNWLPAHARNFSIWLRTYWPDEAILDGTWLPPAIEKECEMKETSHENENAIQTRNRTSRHPRTELLKSTDWRPCSGTKVCMFPDLPENSAREYGFTNEPPSRLR